MLRSAAEHLRIQFALTNHDRISRAERREVIRWLGERRKKSVLDPVLRWLGKHVTLTIEIGGEQRNRRGGSCGDYDWEGADVDDRPICQAVTAAGYQCSRTAELESEYCWQHQVPSGHAPISLEG